MPRRCSSASSGQLSNIDYGTEASTDSEADRLAGLGRFFGHGEDRDEGDVHVD